MGTYIYRVTAKVVDTPVGKANVAVFAYKPWGMFDAEKNARLHFKSGCTASERMFDSGKPTGLVAIIEPATGEVEAVFKNMKRHATFYDGSMGQAEYLPTLYTKDAGVYTFTARREPETQELTLYGRSYPIQPGTNWVVRNQRGEPIDVDKYRNDLAERYPNLKVIDPVDA
jgi:hypothetical protein